MASKDTAPIPEPTQRAVDVGQDMVSPYKREDSTETVHRSVRDDVTFENITDVHGNPSGGFVAGRGFNVHWQNGPLRVNGPNGAFVEDIIKTVINRLQYYNDTKFRCRENSLAITHLEEALHWLQARTADRQRRGVEGTHQV